MIDIYHLFFSLSMMNCCINPAVTNSTQRDTEVIIIYLPWFSEDTLGRRSIP